MSIIQNPDDFFAAINNERNAVRAFVEVLKKEEDALVYGRIDDLDSIASNKSRLAEQLEILVKQRIQYLAFLGYSPDKAGMQMWLSKQTDAEVKAIWNELTELAKFAQQINMTNGKVISTQLQHNQRTYAALQGAAGNISLYGPKGQAFI